jgi:ProP effector
MGATSPLKAIELLAERFPKTFFVYENHRRPLKIGIRQDLVALGILSRTAIKAALRAYCSNRVYRSRLLAGAVRIGLNGESAGTVTEAQAWPPKAAKLPEQPAVVVEALAPNPHVTTTLKRLSLADLRRAAQARKGGAL